MSLNVGGVTDFGREMGQWSLMLRSDTLTSVNASCLYIRVGDSVSLVRPGSVTVESQEELTQIRY